MADRRQFLKVLTVLSLTPGVAKKIDWMPAKEVAAIPDPVKPAWARSASTMDPLYDVLMPRMKVLRDG